MSDPSSDQHEGLTKPADINEDVSKNSGNPHLRVFWEELLNFINEPRFARFAFQFFMIGTGAIIFKVLADRDFPLQDTLQFTLAWFVLMLFLPTPKAARTDVEPFGEEI